MEEYFIEEAYLIEEPIPDCDIPSAQDNEKTMGGSSNSAVIEGKLSKASPKRRKTKKNSMNSDEKHALAAEVRKNNVVWDLSNKLHSRADAVSKAWKEISEKLGKPIEECKAAWTSLRESKRYHAKSKLKTKSGDAGGMQLSQPAFDDDQAEDWEYAKDLDFLPNISKRRRTFTSTSLDESNNDSGSSKVSNYSYIQRSSTSTSTTLDNAGRIADCIEKLVEMQKPAEAPPQVPLMYHSLWANLDRMLQKLPSEMIEDVNFELTKILYTKIKQNENQLC